MRDSWPPPRHCLSLAAVGAHGLPAASPRQQGRQSAAGWRLSACTKPRGPRCGAACGDDQRLARQCGAVFATHSSPAPAEALINSHDQPRVVPCARASMTLPHLRRGWRRPTPPMTQQQLQPRDPRTVRRAAATSRGASPVACRPSTSFSPPPRGPRGVRRAADPRQTAGQCTRTQIGRGAATRQTVVSVAAPHLMRSRRRGVTIGRCTCGGCRTAGRSTARTPRSAWRRRWEPRRRCKACRWRRSRPLPCAWLWDGHHAYVGIAVCLLRRHKAAQRCALHLRCVAVHVHVVSSESQGRYHSEPSRRSKHITRGGRARGFRCTPCCFLRV